MKNLKFYTLICLISFFGQTGAAIAGDRDTDIPDLCVNDIVYSPDGQWKGTVRAIYPGGEVGVQYPGSDNPNNWYRQRAFILGRTKGKIHGFSVGDGFQSTSGRSGKIRAIYLDGSFCTHFDDDADDDTNNGISHETDFYKHWDFRSGHDHDKDHDKSKSNEACKMIDGFKVNDGVYNSSGIHGKVTALNCDTRLISVRYDDGTMNDESPGSLGHDNGCVEIKSCLRKMSFIDEDLSPATRLNYTRFNQLDYKVQNPQPIENYQAPVEQTSGLLAI